MALSEAVRLERERQKTLKQEVSWEREKLLLDKMLTPSVIRLALVAGIMAYAWYAATCERNLSMAEQGAVVGLVGIGIPMVAADAGITDKYALGAISATALEMTALEGLGYKVVSGMPKSLRDFFS